MLLRTGFAAMAILSSALADGLGRNVEPSGRGTDAVWSELASLPITISNNAVTSVDNGDQTVTVYTFMGIESPSSSNSITAASYKMTLPGGAWEQIADAPRLNDRAKIAANAVTVAGDVYLIGGYSAIGFEITEHRLFRYDPAGDQYIELTEVPVEVDDTVAGVYQDRYIYLVSGWHGPSSTNVNNVQVYDTQTDTWTQATPIFDPLPGLFGHAGTIVGNRIMYMDGATIGFNFPISSRAFLGTIDPRNTGDLTIIAWEEVDAHPGSPTYRAAASLGATPDGRMLLVGGTDNTYNITGIGYNGAPSQPLDQVLAYNPTTDQWKVLATSGIHQPTMDHRGLVRVSDDAWVTVGGMIAPTEATDKVFMLTVLPICGNGVVEQDELCDTGISKGEAGACPTQCQASEACELPELLNPGTCSAECGTIAITDPIDGDGCCPLGANANTDDDCPPVCGNSACEPTETEINCSIDCPCDAVEQCDDGTVCTFDRCVARACVNTDAAYGDISGLGGTCGPDGDVGLVDILAILDGFAGSFSEGCSFTNINIAGEQGSCDPNNAIDLADILAVLNAFRGDDGCCSGAR